MCGECISVCMCMCGVCVNVCRGRNGVTTCIGECVCVSALFMRMCQPRELLRRARREEAVGRGETLGCA